MMRDDMKIPKLIYRLFSIPFLTGWLMMPFVHSDAASWNVEPIRVELTSEQTTSAITITNDGDQATSIQAQVVAWSQVEGKDIYTPTKELIISPPIFTINPKQEQIVRVALRKQSELTGEITYRINLQELPTQALTNTSAVQVALRVSLPIFIQMQKGIAVPKMVWHVERLNDNTLVVNLRNQGNAHVQITDLALYLPGTELQIANETVSSYVLSGQGHQWQLKMTSPEKLIGKQVRLKAFTDGLNIDTELALDTH
jgi:fimbrial chaperone protein